MASRTSIQSTRRASGSTTLSMKIYSAFLGAVPRIHGRPQRGPEDTPFHEMTITRQLRHTTEQMSRAIDEARERMRRGKLVKRDAQQGPKPVVLIGPAANVKARRMSPASRAA